MNDLNPIWVRLLGRAQLSNPSVLLVYPITTQLLLPKDDPPLSDRPLGQHVIIFMMNCEMYIEKITSSLHDYVASKVRACQPIMILNGCDIIDIYIRISSDI